MDDRTKIEHLAELAHDASVAIDPARVAGWVAAEAQVRLGRRAVLAELQRLLQTLDERPRVSDPDEDWADWEEVLRLDLEALSRRLHDELERCEGVLS